MRFDALSLKECLLLIVATLFFFSLAHFTVLALEPTGGNFNFGSSERAPNESAGTHQAQAGNVTQVNIVAFSTTQSWQGYYGNVTGTIVLSDSSSSQLYNWSLANPEGEVYASTNNSIDWVNVQCFNFTASQAFGDESGNGGGVNQQGLNLTGLENRFNINESDVDGVDETFTFSGPGTHDLFYTANQEFSEGSCRSTRVFGNSGPTADEYEEVILYEPVTGSVIFAALLEPGSVGGFDGGDHDFEMLVLEDGHGTDVSTTTYYFFVELE